MNGASNTRDVMTEARLFRFLLWYHENRDSCKRVEGFIQSIVEQANSGKRLTEKQIAACESIAWAVEKRIEHYSMLEGHAMDIY